jgi:lipopolysaccharide export system protein LptA
MPRAASFELKGTAKLRQGERFFYGERIEYQLEKRLMRAFGGSEAKGEGKRVRLILPPPKDEATP